MKNLFIAAAFIIVCLLGYFAADQFIFNESEPLKTSGAMEAMQFWTAQRAYPQKDIPSDKYYAAFREKETRMNKITSENEWETMGPHNIGGRTLAIAIDPVNPDIIYAGSAGGGLWRTETAGIGADAWNYIDTGFPVNGVGAIVINPANPNEIYIGTGEVYNYKNTHGGVAIRPTRGSYGIGILKTTDGGDTWSKSLDWSYNQERGVQALEIDPVNSSIIWAGTTEGTFKSTDSGGSWVLVNETIMVTDIAVDYNDPERVFIACGNLLSEGHGIYRTDDGGVNWEKLYAGPNGSYGGKALLHIYESNSSIIYASIGDGSTLGDPSWLCRSIDGGDNWEVVNSSTNYATYQGWFSHFVIVHRNDPNQLLAAGVDVWKSNNGGSTLNRKSFWNKWYLGFTAAGEPEGPDDYSHADHHAYAVHPTNPDIVYLANDGGIFVTEDFGETFEGRNGGYQTSQFYGGVTSAQSDSNSIIGGLQDNATALHIGTLSWYRALGGDGCWTAINEQDFLTYASSQYMFLYRIEGLLQSIEYLQVPTQNASFVSPFVIGNTNPRIMYAASQKIYKSSDTGDNWFVTNSGNSLSNNYAVSLAVSYHGDDTVAVGYAPVNDAAEIFITTDGGDTWIDITGDLPDRYPMDIVFDRENPGYIYVAFSGFGTSHLYKSTDLGNTWIDAGIGLPDVPTSAVTVDPRNSDIIYVGNDLGVYVSIDEGAAWNEFNAGLPPGIFVTDLTYSMANNSLRVSSHGNGVYQTKLLSQTVSSVEDNELANEFELLQNYPNPFNPTTKIKYRLNEAGNVKLKIFDALGQLVDILVDQRQYTGSYEVEFNAEGLASGIYLYSIELDGKQITRKMNFVK